MKTSDDVEDKKESWLEAHHEDIFERNSFDVLQQYIDNDFEYPESDDQIQPIAEERPRTSIYDCPEKNKCLGDSLRLLRDNRSPREVLIYIARIYLQLPYKEMTAIFRLDQSGICREIKKVERKLTEG